MALRTGYCYVVMCGTKRLDPFFRLHEASEVLNRPVTRGAGKRSPPRKISPTWKMCWTWFKSIGHNSKNLGPSQKTLRPSWCPKLVTGLVLNKYVLWVWSDNFNAGFFVSFIVTVFVPDIERIRNKVICLWIRTNLVSECNEHV